MRFIQINYYLTCILQSEHTHGDTLIKYFIYLCNDIGCIFKTYISLQDVEIHTECMHTKHLKQQQNFQTTWLLCNTSLNIYFPIMQINSEIMYIMSHTHTRNVPRTLIWCIRSNFFISVFRVPVSEMALALFTRMSIPPNFFTASSTANVTCFSSLTSTTQGKHLPPAASTEIHVIYQYTRTSHN
jgi:hypothetical protein